VSSNKIIITYICEFTYVHKKRKVINIYKYTIIDRISIY